MARNREISDQGLMSLYQVLQNSETKLEYLDLSGRAVMLRDGKKRIPTDAEAKLLKLAKKRGIYISL